MTNVPATVVPPQPELSPRVPIEAAPVVVPETPPGKIIVLKIKKYLRMKKILGKSHSFFIGQPLFLFKIACSILDFFRYYFII